MKKLILLFFIVLAFVLPNFAQFTTVTYDLERNWFNEGQPLPAEQAMIIKGIVKDEVDLIEFNILSAKRGDELYQATWMKQNANEFAITVPYMLRASDRYDFRIDLFQNLSSTKKQELLNDLKATLATYVDVNIAGEKDLKLLKNSKKSLKELQTITEKTLMPYRNKNGYWASEFSEVVRLKLEQLDKADLEVGYVKGDSSTTRQAVRSNNRTNLINELKAQIAREANRILDTDVLVLSSSRSVDDYATKKKANSLAINVGYGGVYLDGDLDDLDYDAAPYLGIAFPLGNSVLGSRFLSNTSVTMGVFLNQFEDNDGKRIEGFVIDNPIYLGLDHKLFQFIRLNVGATFLEADNSIDQSMSSSNILIRPYVGLSARIDLSVKLGK
ncbi:MAG: hypothetical protein AAF849_06590 [Bacteroidota bacterium]